MDGTWTYSTTIRSKRMWGRKKMTVRSGVRRHRDEGDKKTDADDLKPFDQNKAPHYA